MFSKLSILKAIKSTQAIMHVHTSMYYIKLRMFCYRIIIDAKIEHYEHCNQFFAWISKRTVKRILSFWTGYRKYFS